MYKSIEKLKGKHILIVEDYPPVAETFKKILAPYGSRISQADSAKAALKKIGEERPDIMLLDLGLPDMNGLDVATRLRQGKMAKSIAIIAISGRRDLRERSLEVGCNDFILKPFDTFDLLTRMASLV